MFGQLYLNLFLPLFFGVTLQIYKLKVGGVHQGFASE